MFDITLSPLMVEGGREHMELPGLMAFAAPRKASRLRTQDQLILYLRISGSSNLTPEQQQEILGKLADTYYTTAGPITSSLRAVVVRLNDFLLTRNLRGARDGQSVAVMALAAIHGSSLLLAHGGATHTFRIGKNEVQHFQDSQGVRGLGLGKQIVPRFFQCNLEPGDLLVFCADPPNGWNAKNISGGIAAGGPSGGAPSGIEAVRRRLLSQVGPELHAGLARLQTGKGQVSWFKPVRPERIPAPEGVSAPERPVPPDRVATPERLDPPVLAPLEETSTPVHLETPEDTAVDTGRDIMPEIEPSQDSGGARSFAAPPVEEPTVQPPDVEPEFEPVESTEMEGLEAEVSPPAVAFEELVASTPMETTPRPVEPVVGRVGTARSRISARTEQDPSAVPQRVRRTQKPEPLRERPRKPAGPNPAVVLLGKGVGAGVRTWQSARQAARSAAVKAFPDRKEPFFSLSPASMLAIAVFVPLLVVSIAVAVYMNTGRTEQMALYLYTAQRYAERAPTQAEPQAQREDWNQALLWVRQADAMGESEQGKVLAQQAQGALDQLDGVVRIDFQPVLPGGLGAEVNITRMVATLNDIYLLDSSQGRILRLYRTGSGYEIDPGFTCGPGKAGPQIVGPLIAMTGLPPNNEYRATIMAIDTAGVLVYCSPNQSGFDSRALTPPDTNWGKIAGLTSFNDTLYVLDPQFNAVWYYNGDNGVYQQKPRLFFDSQVPQMTDIQDFAVDQEFLYLLHKDGRVTLCEGSGFEFQPTRCTDPAPFGDTRPGRDPAPLRYEDASLIQVQTTQPPDPSLFFLDTSQQSIYHFSLRRMTYQRQYRQLSDTDFPFPKDQPTAFVITPYRRILVAFADKVFFGVIP